MNIFINNLIFSITKSIYFFINAKMMIVARMQYICKNYSVYGRV